LRLVDGKETPDWDKIRIHMRVGETPVHLSSEQIRKHALLLTSETTRHRDLSIELRTFLVMERLKLDSNETRRSQPGLRKSILSRCLAKKLVSSHVVYTADTLTFIAVSFLPM